MDKKEGYEKSRSLARRALELDNLLPEAHFALAHMLMDDDYPAAEIELKKVLSLNPSHTDAHERYGSVLRGLGRLEESLEEARKAYELDPLPPARAFFQPDSTSLLDATTKRSPSVRRSFKPSPVYAPAYYGRAILNAIRGLREEAYRDLRSYRRLTNEIQYKSIQARIEAHLGNKEEASRLIEETLALVAASTSPKARSDSDQLSYAYALIHDRERFFPFAEYLIDHKLMSPGELRDPSYQNMAGDPRFPELRKKLRNLYGISD